jgi:hypothetical protein
MVYKSKGNEMNQWELLPMKLPMMLNEIVLKLPMRAEVFYLPISLKKMLGYEQDLLLASHGCQRCRRRTPSLNPSHPPCCEE